MSLFRQIWIILWKDIRCELRSKQMWAGMGLFALLVLVIFNFAFDLRVDNKAAVAPGALWVAFVFASFSYWQKSKPDGPRKIDQWLSLIVLGTFLGINLSAVLPYYLPQPKPDPSQISGRPLRLMHMNVFGNVNFNTEAVIKAIQTEQPDMIDFVEYTERWRRKPRAKATAAASTAFSKVARCSSPCSPLSRSRTPLSACTSSDLRPSTRTRTSSSSSVVAATAIAASASVSWLSQFTAARLSIALLRHVRGLGGQAPVRRRRAIRRRPGSSTGAA